MHPNFPVLIYSFYRANIIRPISFYRINMDNRIKELISKMMADHESLIVKPFSHHDNAQRFGIRGRRRRRTNRMENVKQTATVRDTLRIRNRHHF